MIRPILTTKSWSTVNLVTSCRVTMVTREGVTLRLSHPLPSTRYHPCTSLTHPQDTSSTCALIFWYQTTNPNEYQCTRRTHTIRYSYTRVNMVTLYTGGYGTLTHGWIRYSYTRVDTVLLHTGGYGTLIHGWIWYSYTRVDMVLLHTGGYSTPTHGWIWYSYTQVDTVLLHTDSYTRVDTVLTFVYLRFLFSALGPSVLEPDLQRETKSDSGFCLKYVPHFQ